jgi:D-glycero-beta-D-manno-heptose-7-phosphate kinase
MLRIVSMHEHLPIFSAQKKRILESMSRFPQCRILVLGDLMLDVFLWGEVRRISPEAPVPVVEVRQETQLPGGTANVVNNVATLGGKPLVAGVIGSDPAGRELVRLLRKASVSTEGVVIEADRPTTRKTRIIAQNNQQVIRFDHEGSRSLQKESMDSILHYLQENLPYLQAVIISDYAKGVVNMDLMDAIRSLDVAARVPVIVDPKVDHPELYRKVTLITPNHHEASRMTGIEIRDEQSLQKAGNLLRERLECRAVLITRGREGMCLFAEDGRVSLIPTVARRVYDVTGAGDTVIAAMALGIAAGLSTHEAAVLANIAAGIVVGEVGTATVPSHRLAEEIEKLL